jgi:hypothetical protein
MPLRMRASTTSGCVARQRRYSSMNSSEQGVHRVALWAGRGRVACPHKPSFFLPAPKHMGPVASNIALSPGLIAPGP